MIIRIEKSGGSFRGAGLYYLHDKAADRSLDRALKPETNERVWFTDTRNLFETDPQRALDEMWLTADDQAVLKRANGVRTSGRACEDPVKTISLSWHKDDQPTPEHMVEAADAFLKYMGWHEHQAVYVAHRDTEHRHIHIILNKVHPETGRTLSDYREQKRAQSWALAYEREQGQVRCEQREERARVREPEPIQDRTNDAAARREPVSTPQPANDHLPHNVIMLSRPLERQFQADEAVRAEHDVPDQKALLKIEQREARQEFFNNGAALFKATRHAVYDEVREEYRPQWAALYKEARTAEQSAELASDSALSRAFHFAKSGHWEKARDAFGDRDSVRDAVAEDFKLRFAELKSQQMEDLRERQRDACDELRLVRDVEYKELLQRQRLERVTLQSGLSPDVLDLESREQAVPANQNLGQTNALATGEGRQQTEAPLKDVVPAAYQKTDTGAVHADPAPVVLIDPAVLAIAAEKGGGVEIPEPPTPDTGGTNKQITDLVAGGIGGAASYIADQLGELFAPTPPEVRVEQAKQAAKTEASKQPNAPAPEKPISDYDRMIADAIRIAQADQQWWQERDRGKGFERDQ